MNELIWFTVGFVMAANVWVVTGPLGVAWTCLGLAAAVLVVVLGVVVRAWRFFRDPL